MGSYVADIHGQDSTGMGGDDIRVDLRIFLGTITYQEEGKRGIGGQDLSDGVEFVGSIPEEGGTNVPVAKQHRTCRNLLHLEKIGYYIIEIPGTAGHVEDRIACRARRSRRKCPVESSHSGKGKPGSRVLQEYGACCTKEIGDTGLEDGIVHVADDAVQRGGWRDQKSEEPLDCRVLRRLEQLKLHCSPTFPGDVAVEPCANESLIIGNELLHSIRQACSNLGKRKRVTLDALQHGDQVAELGMARIGHGQAFMLQHS